MKTFSFVFDLLNFKLGIFFLFQNGGTKKQHRLIHKPCVLRYQFSMVKVNKI